MNVTSWLVLKWNHCY